MFDGPRPDNEMFGEAAWEQQVFPERLTQCFAAALAQAALSAWHMVRDSNTLADGELGNACANGNDLADQFVSEHCARRCLTGVQFEQVRATKTDNA